MSEVYIRKDNVLSPSPSPESEIVSEVTNRQLPKLTTSETYMLPTEGIGYPVSKKVPVITYFEKMRVFI